jgi:hypothetical protein
VTPSAASTSAGPRKLTKFDAETLAREINLAQSDFPSYTVSPNTESKSDRQDDDRIARCAGGVPESAYKFDASSPDIDKGAIDLSSEISVLPSAAAARRDTRAESSPVALRCARHDLGEKVEGFTIVGITEAQRALSGVPGLGFVNRLKVRSGKRTIRSTDSELDVTRGDTELSIDCENVGKTPCSNTLLRAAATAFFTRADAQVPAAGWQISG